MRRARRERKRRSCEGGRKRAAVDEEIVASNEAGVRGAEEGASRAELLRLAAASGWYAGNSLRARLVRCRVVALCRSNEDRAQPVGLERAGQQGIDGDIMPCDVARDGREESSQPGARAARYFEGYLRHQHAARSNVDDASEFSCYHLVESFLDQLDRRHHAANDALQDLLPADVVIVARRRPQVVGDENVGFRARGKQFALTLRTGNVGGDCRNLGTEHPADVGCRCFGVVAIAAVHNDLASRLCEFLRAGATEPLARRADDGFAASNTKIHGASLISVLAAEPPITVSVGWVVMTRCGPVKLASASREERSYLLRLAGPDAAHGVTAPDEVGAEPARDPERWQREVANNRVKRIRPRQRPIGGMCEPGLGT